MQTAQRVSNYATRKFVPSALNSFLRAHAGLGAILLRKTGRSSGLYSYPKHNAPKRIKKVGHPYWNTPLC